jgi:RimJ/RimL family protein N-acetyltransferase
MSADIGGQPITPINAPLRILLGEDWDRTVRAADGTIIAELRVMTPGAAEQLDELSPLIYALCTWRNNNADCFLDPSRVTPESTRRWLQAISEASDRLLFIVYNVSGCPVAQYGLRRLNTDVVELDNGILGVRGEFNDLFYRIQLRVLEICRSSLGFIEAHARVLADNIPALFLHKRCGLKRIETFKNQGPAHQDIALLSVRLLENTD